MDSFAEIVKAELAKQYKRMKKANMELNNAPEGYLKARKRKRGVTYYQVIGGTEINITREVRLVQALIRKRINMIIAKHTARNIRVLRRTMKQYLPTEYGLILGMLPQSYHQTNELINKTGNATQNMNLFDPGTHKHKTNAGIYVRSKSEVIIANALTSYGIEFRYEARFEEKSRKDRYIYPDFKIRCADGFVIIWEHWGLLSSLDYCIDQAYKVNTYDRRNYVLGKT